MSFSLNISAISFSISTLLAALISWRSFLAWKKQEKNRMSKTFFSIMLYFSFYLGVRAIASLFFSDSASLLTSVYILSHVFYGITASYMIKLAVLAINPPRAQLAFIITLLLYASDILLNIFLPNKPYLNPEMNVIEWGTNKYVGIFHTLLCCLTYILVFTIFISRAIKNWQDYLVRTRCLIIAGATIFGIIITIPRNVFDSPILMLVSDIGLSLNFAIILWGISFGRKKRKAKKSI